MASLKNFLGSIFSFSKKKSRKQKNKKSKTVRRNKSSKRSTCKRTTGRCRKMRGG